MIKKAAQVENEPEVFRLTLSGKVYAPDAPSVEAEIRKAIDSGARHVLLACFSLEQVDSAALSSLIAGLEEIKKRRAGQIIFMGLNDTVRRIITLTKMDKYFPMVADEPAALAHLAALKEAGK